MKHRIFTFSGDALPIVRKLQQEGCEVVVGMVDDKTEIHSAKEGDLRPENADAKRRRLALFDGLVEKRPADLLIREMQGYERLEEYFVFFDRNHLIANPPPRNRGRRSFGSTTCAPTNILHSRIVGWS